MKKIIAILLSIVILLPSIGTLFVSAAETNDYTQGSIIIDCRGTSLTVKVFVTEDDTILIPVDILEVCGGMDCRVEGSEYIYSQGSSSRFERQVYISKNGSYGKTGIQTPHKGYLSGVSITFCDSYTDNRNLYLPLHEVAPFLDAQIEITDDGILHIYPNPISIYEALSHVSYDDLDWVTFNKDDIIGGEVIGAMSLIIESIINLRFDRLDIIFDTGATKDYKKLFEKILIADDTYLSAFDAEETPTDKAYKVINDAMDANNDFIEGVDKTLDYIAKALKYVVGSDKFENYKEFSDDLDNFGDLAKAADGIVKILNYADVSSKMVDDHHEMLFVVYGEGDFKHNPAGVAANEVAQLYSEDTAGVIKSVTVSSLRDFLIKTATKPIKDKIFPFAIVCDALKLVLPELGDLSEDYDIFYLDEIASNANEASRNYYDDMTFDSGSLNDMRLSLIMTLVSSKYAYESYTYFNRDLDSGSNGLLGMSERTRKRITIEEWLEKLYLATDSVECSTPEYYSKTKKELAANIKYLTVDSNTTPDTPDTPVTPDSPIAPKTEAQKIYEAAMRLNNEESLDGVYTLTGIVTIVNNVYIDGQRWYAAY